MSSVAPQLRRPLREHRRALVVIALVNLALFLAGVLLTVLVPETRPGGLGQLHGEPDTPGLGTLVAEAYRSENVAWAATVTFLVNLVLASMLQTTLPSLVVPFLGVVVTAVRIFSWGVLFTPAGQEDAAFLFHYVTLLIEGAAYVLVAFATWVQARRFLQPRRYGLAGHGAGYVAGLRATARIYVWVVVLLVIGAIYEAFSVIYLVA
ncbi:hypothetical protein [Cryptosporangium japonicum]|uniref:Integral membrane protein n=1 Tax=Cryptosporangium japonicum TaxID=80872 RepID=A0ABN0TRW5_9ACTN